MFRPTAGDLWRRLEEVRGLAGGPAAAGPPARDPAALRAVVGELVEELERSHRRLIETHVQLVSLREVASRLVAARDEAEITRTVTRYLARAFGFEEVFLFLLQREEGRLVGTWTHGRGTRDHSLEVAVPAGGDGAAVGRALWLHRSILHHSARHHPPLRVAEGHPLKATIDRLGSCLCVPLERSQAVLPATQTHELCGAHCILGDTEALAPPPGSSPAAWAASRDQRQAHCLACELFPALGVVGVARAAGSAPLEAADAALLESIALSVAPLLEAARLGQQLRRSERFREHVLDSMAGALVAVSLDAAILTFNRAAETLTGWSAADAVGRSFGELFGIDGEAHVHAALADGEERAHQEVVLSTREGAALPVSLSTALLRDEARAVHGAIATFVDLRPVKRAEEHARRLDRLAALGRFTAGVAHEIRNPLAGIASGVQYLARVLADDPRGRDHVDFLLAEIRRLDRILQELFDLTHPRAISPHVASLEPALHRALRCVEGRLAERGVRIDVAVAPGTPVVSHDPDALEQVILNLLKNAAEASPEGGRIQVALEPGDEGVRLRIADQGPGLSGEQLRTLFEPFVTTKSGGSGLGLYLSHEIVKRHGGTLTAHSEPGAGASFELELPTRPQGQVQGGHP